MKPVYCTIRIICLFIQLKHLSFFNVEISPHITELLFTFHLFFDWNADSKMAHFKLNFNLSSIQFGFRSIFYSINFSIRLKKECMNEWMNKNVWDFIVTDNKWKCGVPHLSILNKINLKSNLSKKKNKINFVFDLCQIFKCIQFRMVYEPIFYMCEKRSFFFYDRNVLRTEHIQITVIELNYTTFTLYDYKKKKKYFRFKLITHDYNRNDFMHTQTHTQHIYTPSNSSHSFQ